MMAGLPSLHMCSTSSILTFSSLSIFSAIYDFNLSIISRILYWNLSLKVSKRNSPCLRFLAIYFVHHLIVVASLKYWYSLSLSYITTSLHVLLVFILFTQLTLVYLFFNIDVLAIW
ncbi:hypothetical protein AAZV13_07G140800 [Glycine max]